MTLSGGQIAEDLSWMFANITAHADPAGLHPGTYEQVTVVFLEPLMTGGVRVGLPAVWSVRQGIVELAAEGAAPSQGLRSARPLPVRIEREHALPRYMYAVPIRLQAGRLRLAVSDEPVARVVGAAASGCA